MTIGDVLAAVAIVVGLYLSGWALLIGLALLFTGFATKAQRHLETTPGAALGLGFVLVAVVGVGSVALLNAPNALLKLVGWLLLLVLLLCSALGASGLALLMNGRIRGMEPELSEFRALCRGGAILVLAGLMPLLGWFIVTPLVIMASLGASTRTLWQARRNKATVVASPNITTATPGFTPLTAPVTETTPAPMMAASPTQAPVAYPFATPLPATPPRMASLSNEPATTSASTLEDV